MSSVMRNFAYFSNAIDREEMAKCGPYDRTLVYVSTFRLLITVVFVFFVSLYGLSTLLPELWMAIVLASLLAAAVYGFDAAILGYEWTLHREVSPYWVVNAPIVFFYKLLLLTPRILYALGIAFAVATLAELEFQSKAIDRELRVNSRKLNEKYFSEINVLTENNIQLVEKLEEDILETESAIQNLNDTTVLQETTQLNTSLEAETKNISTFSEQINEFQSQLASLRSEVGPLRAKVNALKGEVGTLSQQMEDELTIERCADLGNPLCKGKRWREFRDLKIIAQTEFGLLNPELTSKEKLIKETQRKLEAAEVSLKNSKLLHKSTREDLQELDGDGRDLSTLKIDLIELRKDKVDAEKKHEDNLQALKDDLKNAGFYDPADYDIFDRYVGLGLLQRDPVEQGNLTDEQYAIAKSRALSAREISYGILIFMILIEMIPVFVVMFFMPFSFYSQKMREKRDIAVAQSDKASLDRRLAKIIRRRKRQSEILNQKTKLFHAKQQYKRRKHEIKTDIKISTQEKSRELKRKSDEVSKLKNKESNLEIKKELNAKIVELEEAVRLQNMSALSRAKVDQATTNDLLSKKEI